MPKVIPVAIRDQTGDFIRQMAQGNEALARLYVQLLARYEERLAAQEYRSGERDRTFDQQERMIRLREELYRGRKAPDDGAIERNPLSRGGGGDVRRTTPPTAAPTTPAPAAAPPPPPAYRPMPSIKGGADIPGTQQFKPQGSDSKKFSALDDTEDPMNAYAQGTSDATDFSAQSRQPTSIIQQGGTATRPEKGTPGTIRPGTSVRDPARLPTMTTAKTKMAEFLPIRREWIDMMASEEKKHGLPQGSLLTLYGMENGGGRVFGNNPNRAYGMFQFTKQLREQYGISDADAMNPAVMIPATAANLRANANEYKRITGKDLPNTTEYMPHWTALHQWGIGDGPRLVAAALAGAGHMPAQKVMLEKPGGVQRDRGKVLALNQLDPGITVAGAIKDQSTRGGPYHSTALKVMDSPDDYTTDGSAQPPRPPADIPNQQGSMGTNPRLMRAVLGGASLALPQGYTVQQTSGHRPGDSGYHGRREAGDFKIVRPDGTSIRNKGEDTTGLYTRVARGVKTWLAENDPGFQVNWGGAHSTQKRGGTVPDLMHFDTGHDRGSLRPELRMSQLKPLSTEERNAPEQGRRSTAVAAAPAAAAVTTEKAQAPATPQASTAYTQTPMEGKNAAATAAMFDVKPQEPLADMLRGSQLSKADRGFGEPMYRPIPRDSERTPYVDQGPQLAQARPQAPERASLGNAIPSTMPEMPGTAALPRQLPPIVPTPQPYGADFDAVPPAAPTDVFSSGEYANVPEMPTMQVDAADEAARMAADPVESTYPDIDTSTGVPPDMGAGANVPPIAPQAPTPPATPATPQAVDKPQMGEYSPFNAPARMERGRLARQGAGEVASTLWQGAKGAVNAIRNPNIPPMDQDQDNTVPSTPLPSAQTIRDAIFGTVNGQRDQQRPNLDPMTQSALDAAKRWMQEGSEPRPPPQLDPYTQAGVDAIKRTWEQGGSNVTQPLSARLEAFKNAVQEWVTNRDAPRSVKTINPVAPTDPGRIKPIGPDRKNFPDQRVPQDEPLVLTKPPGSAYVPFQGMTPGSAGNMPGAPVMPRKGGAATTAPTGRNVILQRDADGNPIFVAPNEMIPPLPEDQQQVDAEQ